MKKLLALLLIMGLLGVTGCSWSEPKQPPMPPKENKDVDDAHINVKVKDLTFGISNQPKFFKQEQIAADEGFVVVGVGIVLINDNKEKPYYIDPKFVTVTTDDGKTYKYNEAKTNAITGKGALKATDLQPSWRLSGLLLFDIKENTKLKSVSYSDTSGHTIKIDLNKGPTGV